MKLIPKYWELWLIALLSFIEPVVLIMTGAVAYTQSGWSGVAGVAVGVGIAYSVRRILKVRQRIGALR